MARTLASQNSWAANDVLDSVMVDPNSGCWLYTGAVYQGTGYGQVRWKGTSYYAHRASYERHCGEIPAGMSVLHKCDTRPCINPKHLFLGTAKDNSEDMWAKGRNSDTATLPQRRRKLTDKQVIEIYSCPNKYGVKAELARKYGVAAQSIADIRRGKNYQILLSGVRNEP